MSEIHLFFTLTKCIILKLHNAKSIRKKDSKESIRKKIFVKKSVFVKNKH